jgi:hypothetical protein
MVPLDTEDSNSATNSELPNVRKKKRIMLSDSERRIIYEALLEKSVNGKPKLGTTKIAASQFPVNMRIVQHIWKLADNK